ncbi:MULTISPECIES: hypothetical protein [unclassified Nostoc]|uniref:hypothetical protein n=1 Tax=unclassified Nostoc TaxID=2593658 RepID=UPI002AD789E4|nr:hypothetical protein [Nostoc sp. DedQUE02]
MAHAQMHDREIANHRVVMQRITVLRKTRKPLRPVAFFHMTQTKGKYVTRKKRIRQLEKEIEQLKCQVKTLTQLLDDAHGIIYRSRPGLARAVERDFHEELLPSELPPAALVAIAKKRVQRKIRNLSIAPRADLVMERDSNGRLVAKPK